jgi:hypothetical protein
MNIWIVLLAAQVLVAVVALMREPKNDERFDDDKLGYRS